MNRITYTIVGGHLTINSVESFMESINHFQQTQSVFIQVFNAERICGKIHLQSAVEHALRAMKQNRMSTQSLQMEILLYAAGERQLTHAIPKIGVKKGKGSIGIVLLKEDEKHQDLTKEVNLFLKQYDIKKDESVLDMSIDKIHKWGLSKEILQRTDPGSYQDIILERVAMVDIIK